MELLTVPDRSTIKGKWDYVILALLLGCTMRRQELASLDVNGIRMREPNCHLKSISKSSA